MRDHTPKINAAAAAAATANDEELKNTTSKFFVLKDGHCRV
jgi:hypothetical protein